MSETNTEVVGDPATNAPLVTPEFSPEETVISAQFTAEDISKARAQEKAKLYPKLEKLEEEVTALRKEREEREALEVERKAQRAARDAEAAKKKKEEQEAELGFKELLQKKEEEFNEKLEAERQARESALTLLDREREYQELTAYRQQRLEQERDGIIPELIDLIQGNNKDEIEQSIAGLKERSSKIFENVAAASQQTRKEMVGARITAPANGPLDNDSDPVSASPDTLRNMSMADYAKNREKLLGSTGTNRGQGLFG